MTQQRTAMIGLGTAVLGFTMLALQGSYAGDFMSYANTAVAVLVGIYTAAIVTRLVRSVGGAWSAHRLRRINRRSLIEAAEGHGAADGLELAALMLDRVGLIAPRLAALPAEDAEWSAGLLAEVRVGIDIVELRRLHARLSPAERGGLKRLMWALADHFQTDAVDPPQEVLTMIDACLDLFGADLDNPARRSALIGLTDLRRSLFPSARSYGSERSVEREAELAA